MPSQDDRLKTVAVVVREHVERAARDRPGVPAYLLAVELGISPSTLARMRRRWATTRKAAA